MYYNINYEIVAIVVLIILMATKWRFFTSKDKIEHQFMMVVVVSFIACAIDIVAAFCYSSIIDVGDRWLLVIETIYLLFAMFGCYMQLRVVCLRVKYGSEFFRLFNFIMTAVMTIVLLINIGTKFMFEYKEHQFVGYPLFNSIYIVNGILFLEMAIVLIMNRKMIRKKILAFTSSIFVFPVICILIQFLDDRILLSGFGATAAFLMFSFTLGDQDYDTVQETLNELQATKEAERQKRNEMEAAYRVKNRFMETISCDLDKPITEIIFLSENMKQKSEDAQMERYIEQIDEASKQLLRFVDQLTTAAKEEN